MAETDNRTATPLVSESLDVPGVLRLTMNRPDQRNAMVDQRERPGQDVAAPDFGRAAG